MEQVPPQKYGLRRSQVGLPRRDLIVVPHLGGDISVSTFGPNNYRGNLSEMQKAYSHKSEDLDLPRVSFREPKTPESILVASYGFGEGGEFDAKRDIFDPGWLQAGRIVRTEQGVIVNPLLDKAGNAVLNSVDLEAQKTNSRKVQVGKGHIYLRDNGFGFAEYKTFQRDVQNCDIFAESGLARVIEHTEGPAEKLRAIVSRGNYPKGVYVWGFETPNEPIERVLSLDSSRDLDDGRLGVSGINWVGDNDGCAFGVRQ